MGYFANSTEASMFCETYCVRCQNFIAYTEKLCLIWELHYEYNYKLCNSKSLAKKFLDLMIDNSSNDIRKWKCAMFKEKK